MPLFAGTVFLLTTCVTLLVLLRVRREPGLDLSPPKTLDILELRKPRPLAPAAAFTPHERRNVALFRAVAPSVVHVDAVGTTLLMQRADEVPPDGVGSGFVWSRRGHIVTSLHVVRNRSGASTVTLADGSKWPAEFVGMDEEHDLAVLAIPAPAERLVPIRLGSSAGLAIGQDVLAIGNPFGLDHTLTSGVISGLNRTIGGEGGTLIKGAIQHDAPMHMGNSGGPLLDSSGRLIGINAAIRPGSSQLAFAIPVDVINRVVPRIIDEGMESWPELGFVLAPEQWGLEQLQASGWTEETGLDFGVVVVEIQLDGPAAKAGMQPLQQGLGTLKLGDVIVAVDGTPLASRDQLSLYLDALRPGDRVRLGLRRFGEPQEVELTFQAR